MYLAYVFKRNSNCEKLVILLMIPDREKYEGKSIGWEQWHYLAVKKNSVFLGEISSKIMVIFIVWIVLIPLEQNTNVNSIKSMWK